MHIQVAENDLNVIDMALYRPLQHVGDTYHEMAQLFKSRPHHYKLRQRFSELNCLWDIQHTPAGTCGAQQSLETHLVLSVWQLVSSGA